MAITASTISSTQSLEEFRLEYNKLQSDVTSLKDNPTYGSSLIFEGSTEDANEVSLTVADPTADRTVTIPDASGTILLTGAASFAVGDGGTIGSSTTAEAMTIASDGVVTFASSPVFSSISATGDFTVDSGGDVILDADGGDIFFKDAGSTFGSATNTSGNLIIKSGTTTAATFAGANTTLAGTLGVGAITTTGAFKGADGYTIGNASVADIMTLASTGIVTFKDDILIKDTGTIGSASDPNAIGISAAGVISITATTANTSASDGALTVAGGVGIAADLSVGDDLRLISDDAVLSFGLNSDVTVTHDPDDGLIFKSLATADNNPFLLTLQTGETDMAANDVIGKITFQAPDEGTGTDAIKVAAAIQAFAEGDFSATSN
jgi:hypothetical protein